jgi:type II secretory pathway component PulJ
VPQLMLLALVGAAAYAGYRWLSRSTRQISVQVRRTEDALRRHRAVDMGRLEYDPVSGVYRPARRH